MARLGGNQKTLPILGGILGFAAMASLGLPGLAGFWGEFPAILSAYQPAEGLPVETFRTYMVIAAIGTVLAAAYLLWLFQRTAFGEPTEEFSGTGGVHDGHGPVARSVSAAARDEHGDHDGHDDHGGDIHDVGIYEWIAWTPMLVAILVLGVYPQLLFEIIDPAVNVALKAF
jgi:NADH-quinone oxidoreductase subunit M